ncbi:MAG: hypothetical protein ACP5Q4_07835 [Candidatus Caldatribacteriaceae bacterium]
MSRRGRLLVSEAIRPSQGLLRRFAPRKDREKEGLAKTRRKGASQRQKGGYRLPFQECLRYPIPVREKGGFALDLKHHLDFGYIE